jgi:hypothetical protein
MLKRLIIFAAGAALASAGVIFDNLADANEGNRDLSHGGIYQSFSTGVNPFQLTDVKLILEVGTLGSNTFSVDVYNDSSSTPGTLLANVGSKLDNQLAQTFATIDFATNISLGANTRYWIGITSSSGSTVIWTIEPPNSNPGDIGVSGQFIKEFNTVSSVTAPSENAAFQMRITGNDITAGTPEPAAIVLTAAGLLGLTAIRRRRQQRQVR